jgi:YbbR domain-containing protein
MSRTARLQNVFLMVVSLMLAIVLYLHVQSQTTPGATPQSFNVKVRLGGLPNDFVVVKEPPTVTVMVSGVADPKSITGEPIAAVDLSDPKVGPNSCQVLLEPPPGIRMSQLEVVPQKVMVNVDLKASRRGQKVLLKLSGLQSDDLIFNGVTVQPAQVDISGPKQFVDSVAQVRVIFDLSKAKPGVSQALTVEPLDKNDKIVRMVTCDPVAIVARPSLLPAPTKKSLIVSPKWKGQPAFGYEIASVEVQPNMVEVEGKSETLSRLATIETEPVSIEGLAENKDIEVRMVVPQGVAVGVSRTVRVRVRVVKTPPVAEPPKVTP